MISPPKALINEMDFGRSNYDIHIWLYYNLYRAKWKDYSADSPEK